MKFNAADEAEIHDIVVNQGIRGIPVVKKPRCKSNTPKLKQSGRGPALFYPERYQAHKHELSLVIQFVKQTINIESFLLIL